ncbi:MAG: hypothetical protein K1X66_03745 [Verrucomicrobiae bacterium]|nr:hypothetical protein [Verrucomicrobiae bacterium]
MGKLGIGGRIVRRLLGGNSARIIAGQRRLAAELTLAINNVLKVGESCSRAGALFRSVERSRHGINLAKLNSDLSDRWLNSWISKSGQGAEATLTAQAKFAEKVKNLKGGLAEANKNLGAMSGEARELSNSAKGVYGQGFSDAQAAFADQLYNGAEDVWKLARQQKGLTDDAAQAVAQVEDLLKETPPNLGAIQEAWDVAKRKVDAVYAVNEQMAKAGQTTIDAGKNLYRELPPQLVNGTILAVAGGVDHGDYRPELQPHPMIEVGKAAGEKAISGLEAIDWVETQALNFGGTVVTGALSLVSGGHVPIITDSGDRLDRAEEAFGAVAAKVVREDGKRLDAAFQQAEKQTAGFLDQMDRDALSGGKAWLGF